MVKVLALIGGLVVVCVVIIILYAVVLFCEHLLHEVVKKYKIKHRFDKPPTAKCYCRDCKRWNPKTGECSDSCNSRLMNPAWFCWYAEPIGSERFEKREEIIKDTEKFQG